MQVCIPEAVRVNSIVQVRLHTLVLSPDVQRFRLLCLYMQIVLDSGAPPSWQKSLSNIPDHREQNQTQFRILWRQETAQSRAGENKRALMNPK